jgi:DNA-binding NtrC family response regulator
MSRLNVLVISPGSETGSWLASRLSPGRFAVSTARPGPDLIRAVRLDRPHVAVLDGIHSRPGVAPLEVALLKDHSPDVRIVALSGESSDLDGDVIEQGVFCYLAGCRRDELLRVIEAAASERLSPSGCPSIPIEPESNP